MPDVYFRELRNVELSTVYYIENQINDSWDDVNVVKGFPNFPKQSLPCISVRILDTFTDFLEIGSRLTTEEYSVIIDIFANSDGQRMDLADFIKEKILADWVYYLHSKVSGNPEALARNANGRVNFRQFTQNARVDLGPDVEVYDKYRHVIAFNVSVS